MFVVGEIERLTNMGDGASGTTKHALHPDDLLPWPKICGEPLYVVCCVVKKVNWTEFRVGIGNLLRGAIYNSGMV